MIGHNGIAYDRTNNLIWIKMLLSKCSFIVSRGLFPLFFFQSYLKSSSLFLINNTHVSHLSVFHLGTLPWVAVITSVGFFCARATISSVRPRILLRKAWYLLIFVLSLTRHRLIEDLAKGALRGITVGMVNDTTRGSLPRITPHCDHSHCADGWVPGTVLNTIRALAASVIMA